MIKPDYFDTARQLMLTVFTAALPVNFDVRECNETMFMCLSELQCVPTANRCDNKLECHDGSDEHQCQYFYYGHSCMYRPGLFHNYQAFDNDQLITQ